jgi:transposase InsO family protein
MAGKRKTTMAKLNRERKLRERRVEKQVKKTMRKRAAAEHAGQPSEAPTGDEDSGTSNAG